MISRRSFIAGQIPTLAAAPAFGQQAASDVPTPAPQPVPAVPDLAYIDEVAAKTNIGLPSIRGLWLVNPHTREELKAVFWNNGQYDNAAYTQICALMRDWREGVVSAMDPHLLHILWAVQRQIGFSDPICINSGFRTMKTNEMLRAEGAAINSQHLHSRACDVTLAGKTPRQIGSQAQIFGIGGVGLYPTFCHLDSGEKRSWGA